MLDTTLPARQNQLPSWGVDLDSFGSRDVDPQKVIDAEKLGLSTDQPLGQKGKEGDYFDISKFEQLLNRLEASKGRQQRQKSLEGRRDIFAQGLATMMSNF